MGTALSNPIRLVVAAALAWTACSPRDTATIGVGATVAATTPMDRTVAVSVRVDEPNQIISLSWPLDLAATSYTVARKDLGALAWEPATALAGAATGYDDVNIQIGWTYEYQVIKNGPVQAVTYLVAGVHADMIGSRGTVVLVVERSLALPLAAELARLTDDLVGDAWRVVRHDVGRNDAVTAVKALIVADAQKDPAVRTVFLFGHVPVPYSGLLNPDGHPDHLGAWPADLYYGALSQPFTDISVNYNASARVENRNVPGDGKFDQTYVPTVELEVGRVDLANLPSFGPRTEVDLLRQYLNKDHAFRHRLFSLPRRGLVDDNFGDFGGEAFAASGYRNFIADFGPGSIDAGPLFPALAQKGYLAAYGCGGGWFQGAGGVGTTADWALTDAHAVFTMLFGSYFGDWDASDDFLRAPLGSASYTLTSVWSGRPQFYLQFLALGETIGYGVRATQNNQRYFPGNYGNQWVHAALMGDPTLRLHPVLPPGPPTTKVLGRDVTVTWPASLEADQGYLVYRDNGAGGDQQPLIFNPQPGLTYLDSGVVPGHYRYMIRALRLEAAAAGTYLNPSQGVFVDALVQ